MENNRIDNVAADENESMQFLDYLKKLKEDYRVTEGDIYMTDPKQLSALQVSFEILKIITKGEDVIVTYDLNQGEAPPFNSYGSVTVVGKSLEFFSCEWFIKVSKLASNISIFPLADGRVEYTLTFHNLTNKIYSNKEVVASE